MGKSNLNAHTRKSRQCLLAFRSSVHTSIWKHTSAHCTIFILVGENLRYSEPYFPFSLSTEQVWRLQLLQSANERVLFLIFRPLVAKVVWEGQLNDERQYVSYVNVGRVNKTWHLPLLTSHVASEFNVGPFLLINWTRKCNISLLECKH